MKGDLECFWKEQNWWYIGFEGILERNDNGKPSDRSRDCLISENVEGGRVVSSVHNSKDIGRARWERKWSREVCGQILVLERIFQ